MVLNLAFFAMVVYGIPFLPPWSLTIYSGGSVVGEVVLLLALGQLVVSESGYWRRLGKETRSTFPWGCSTTSLPSHTNEHGYRDSIRKHETPMRVEGSWVG